MIIGKNVGLKKPDKLGRISFSKKMLDQIGYDDKTDFFQVEQHGDKLILHKFSLRAIATE